MVATQNYIPKAAQNLLSGQLQSPFSDTDSYFVGDVLPPASKLPTYFWIDYGSSSAELVKVYDVSGNNVYCKRGINNGGVGIAHNANAPYREAITIEHWNTLVDAVQSGWLTEPLDVYTVSQVSTTEFKIVGVDRTSYYTAGVRVKINGTITTYVVSSTLSGSDTIVTVGDAVVPSTISALELKLSVSPDDPVITTEHNPDGTHGDVTLANSTDFTTEHNSDGTHKFDTIAGFSYDSLYRQAIINGNFDIWQRGTSFSITGGVAYTADRWLMQTVGSSMTVSQQSFTLGQTEVPHEPKYYLRSVVSSVAGAGNYAVLSHRIESVRTFAGQTVTVSFWAKADTPKNIAVEFVQVFGSGGTPSSPVTGIGSQLVALTTFWTKYTITVSIPSISGKTVGTTNDGFLELLFWFDAGSDLNTRTASLGQQSGTFDIAQVQLNAGSSALPFMPRSYEEELRKCQRYYYRINATSNYQRYGHGYVENSTTAYVDIFLPVTMRTQPTSIDVDTASNYRLQYQGGGYYTASSISLTTSSNNQIVVLSVNSSGMTTPKFVNLTANNVSGTYLGIDAEL